jgi:hypothetical protein
MAPVLHTRNDVETTCANVAHESENIENVAAVGPVHAALHGQAEKEHGDDREHEQEAAHISFLDQVACARNEPRHEWGDDGHGGKRRRFYGRALPDGAVTADQLRRRPGRQRKIERAFQRAAGGGGGAGA